MGRRTSTLPGAGMQTLIHVVYSCTTYNQLVRFTVNLQYANMMSVLKIDGASMSVCV